MRGDVWALKPLGGAAGREQRGTRFAVELQNDALQALSAVVAAPTSTSVPESALHPELTVRGTRTRVLVEQLRAIDRSRLGRRVSRCDAVAMEEIDDALRAVVGLD